MGWHRPLKNHHHNFIDKVSNKTVFNAECSCGKMFMVDSPFWFFGFKVEKENKGNLFNNDDLPDCMKPIDGHYC